MPLVSAEVRWFIPDRGGAEVSAVAQWFESGAVAPGGGKKARRDTYVLDRSTDELGIKARGNKAGLEVKTLIEAKHATVNLGARAGQVQTWAKVTSTALSLPQEPSKQIITSKLRRTRKFDTFGPEAREILLGGGDDGEDPLAGAPPEVGCNVEWTMVELAGRSWRTLGLESFAFSHSDGYSTLLPSLQRTLAALVQNLGPAPTLSAEWHELSYPAWLCGAGVHP